MKVKIRKWLALFMVICLFGALVFSACGKETEKDERADLKVTVNNCANDEIIVKYNGQAQEVSYSASDNKKLTVKYSGKGDTEYTESETAPADAGTYSVKFSYGGDEVYKPYAHTITLTIMQAEGILEIAAQDVVFGNEIKPEVVQNIGGGEVTYSYEGIEGTEYPASSSAPSALGKYRITATASATRNYKSATATAEFSIVKAKGETPEKPVLISVTDTVITVQTQIGLEYSTDKVTWEADGVLENLSPMRTYNVYARTAETENYGVSDPSEPLEVMTAMPDTIKASLENKVTVAEKFGENGDLTLAAPSWETNDDLVKVSSDSENISTSQKHGIYFMAKENNLDWIETGRKIYILVDAEGAGYLWIHFSVGGRHSYDDTLNDLSGDKFFAEPEIGEGLALLEITIPVKYSNYTEDAAAPVTGFLVRGSESFGFTIHGIYRDDIVYREELPADIAAQTEQYSLLSRDFSSGALTLVEDGGWNTNGSFVNLQDGVLIRPAGQDNGSISLKSNDNALAGISMGGKMRFALKATGTGGSQALYIALTAGDKYTYETVINDNTSRKYFFEMTVSEGWQIVELDIGNLYADFAGSVEDPVTGLFIWTGSGAFTLIIDSVYYDAPAASEEVPEEILSELSGKSLISGDFSQGNLTLTAQGGWNTNTDKIIVNEDGTLSHTSSDACISLTISENAAQSFAVGKKIYLVVKSEESANKSMYLAIAGGENKTYETIINDHTNRISFVETTIINGWQILEINLSAYDKYAGEPDTVPTCLFIWGDGSSAYTIHSVYAE